MNFKELPYTLKRVYEIALSGNHTLMIVTSIENKDYMDSVIPLLEEVVIVLDISKADIIYELTRPDFDEIKGLSRNGETVQDIQARIDKVGKDAKYPDANESFTTLIKTAYRRLMLSPERLDRIKKLTITIATLDDVEVAGIQHLAEAINYNSMLPDVHESNIWVEIQPTEAKLFPNREIFSTPDKTLLKVNNAFVTYGS